MDVASQEDRPEMSVSKQQETCSQGHRFPLVLYSPASQGNFIWDACTVAVQSPFACSRAPLRLATDVHDCARAGAIVHWIGPRQRPKRRPPSLTSLTDADAKHKVSTSLGSSLTTRATSAKPRTLYEPFSCFFVETRSKGTFLATVRNTRRSHDQHLEYRP